MSHQFFLYWLNAAYHFGSIKLNCQDSETVIENPWKYMQRDPSVVKLQSASLYLHLDNSFYK